MGRKVVACCGCFDGTLHPGHRYFLRKAKAAGSTLIVFVNADEIIRRHKHREPIYAQAERVAHVAELGIATQVIPFCGCDVEKQIAQIAAVKPDIYFMTDDGNPIFNEPLREQLTPLGTTFVTIRRHRPELYSTTKLHFSDQGHRPDRRMHVS